MWESYIDHVTRVYVCIGDFKNLYLKNNEVYMGMYTLHKDRNR